MLLFYKVALAPILLFQGRRLRQTALRLPEAAGPRQGVEQGTGTQAPLRILVLGDSSAAGVGVDDQAQALAQPLASCLAQKLNRPVAWQLVAQSGVNSAEALVLLKSTELQPADFLVTALGVNDVTSQQTPARFLQCTQALVEEAKARSGISAHLVTGLPPMGLMPAVPQPLRWYLGRYAARLDRALGQWVERAEHTHYVSLAWMVKPGDMARDGFHPGAVQYRLWAELVAAQIVMMTAKL